MSPQNSRSTSTIAEILSKCSGAESAKVRRGSVRADQLTELVHLSRDALQAFMSIYPNIERQFSAIAEALHAGNYEAVYEDKHIWARELEIMEVLDNEGALACISNGWEGEF